MKYDFWRGKRVFLTGHTGFKGSWLGLRLLDAGATLTGYALPPETKPNAYELLGIDAHMTSVLADVRDASALAQALRRAKPEIVVHMAAQPLVRRGYREPRATFETNVMGTVNLLDAMRDCEGISSALIVTSDKTYANHTTRAQREDDPLGGDDPYSASKACAEIVAQAYRRSYFPNLATARAGNVIGGGDFSEDRLIPDLVRASSRNEPVRLRYPKAIRPWQFVGDALDGYLSIVERLATDVSVARAWNLGPQSGGLLTVEELAERFATTYDRSIRITIDTADTPPEAPYLALDAGAARDILGWRPGYDAPAAIDATAAWYRAWRDGADLVSLTRAQMRAEAVVS